MNVQRGLYNLQKKYSWIKVAIWKNRPGDFERLLAVYHDLAEIAKRQDEVASELAELVRPLVEDNSTYVKGFNARADDHLYFLCGTVADEDLPCMSTILLHLQSACSLIPLTNNSQGT